ncbi:MAG: tRNA pseudouridine(55) synthase TruB [Firmicutes bacterium]|nr:tRNA pseudouridine(55) synthase TruB [Bacillota bacterium]MBO2520362.1 tRNA pseudouridine(55) synthase TruB [Bacillota bacterium]
MNSGAPAVPSGVINLLKPPGITSHDAVAKLRRMLGQRRIGHGGTLDPGAAGVLPILVGQATKLMPFVSAMTKSYRAEMTLGIVTDTQDASGATVSVSESFSLPPARLGDAMAAFLGTVEQVPPMVSAVKSDGRRLYELAREGKVVERAPRRVEIYEMHVVAVLPRDTERLVIGTRVIFDVVCSKGTYIRTLCHDIGQRLGCGAHMSFLVRTRVGPYTLDQSWTFDEIERAMRHGRLPDVILSPETAVAHLPRYPVTGEEASRLRHGQKIRAEARRLSGELGPSGLVRVVQEGAGLVCIGAVDAEAGLLSPVRVL